MGRCRWEFLVARKRNGTGSMSLTAPRLVNLRGSKNTGQPPEDGLDSGLSPKLQAPSDLRRTLRTARRTFF